MDLQNKKSKMKSNNKILNKLQTSKNKKIWYTVWEDLKGSKLTSNYYEKYDEIVANVKLFFTIIPMDFWVIFFHFKIHIINMTSAFFKF